MANDPNNAAIQGRTDCDHSFENLIQRVRARDEQAAAELVRRYEPHVRRAVRVRLGDPALRQVVDSMDICQSVLANFFIRTASGEFEIDQPRQLIALLVSMAQNKIHDWHRKQGALRRDQRRKVPLNDSVLPHFATRDMPSAHRIAEAKELLEQVDRRLPRRERKLVRMRSAGYSWAEIAQREDASPDALRVGLHRHLNRISQELGIDG